MTRQEVIEKLNKALELLVEVSDAHIDKLPKEFNQNEFYEQMSEAQINVENCIDDLEDKEDFSNVYETDNGEGRWLI